MLNGCDLSNNNKKNYKRAILLNDFVIIKASEGRTYKDAWMNIIAEYARKRGKMIGFYHFARPENGNTYKQEADNFIAQVKPYIGEAVLVLDYEGSAHKCGQDWAVNWINYVKAKTGVLPMFYTSEAYLPNYNKVADTGAGLWVAKYSKTKPFVSPWKFWAVWQHTDTPWDKDKFNGTRAAWKKYAEVTNGEA